MVEIQVLDLIKGLPLLGMLGDESVMTFDL